MKKGMTEQDNERMRAIEGEKERGKERDRNRKRVRPRGGEKRG